MGWEWGRVGSLCNIRGGKRVSNGYQFSKTKTPFVYIRVSDFKNGTIDDSDLYYIDENMRSKIDQYIITVDDIYMTIVGATIGKCGLVPEKFNNMNLTENAARVTPFFVEAKQFILTCFNSEFCQNQFIGNTKQVGVQKMALVNFSNSLLPLPPLAEQHRIVAKVDQLFALCDQLKARIQIANQLQLQLTDTLIEQTLA